MGEIVNHVFEKELYYEDVVILTYKIRFPQLKKTCYRYGAQKFNQFYYERAVELKEYCENELFKEAKELYELNQQNGYPIMVYEIILDYEVTYQANSVIALYMDEYMFLGGAHGNTKRESQNWNLRNGKQIAMQDLFLNQPYYIIDILKEINEQIAAKIETGEGQYFDNYCQLVQENFRLENFYLVEGRLDCVF